MPALKKKWRGVSLRGFQDSTGWLLHQDLFPSPRGAGEAHARVVSNRICATYIYSGGWTTVDTRMFTSHGSKRGSLYVVPFVWIATSLLSARQHVSMSARQPAAAPSRYTGVP